MQRTVSAELSLRVDGAARLAFIVAVADRSAAERLELRHDGARLHPNEVTDAAGSRIHVVDVEPGTVTLSYGATVEGQAATPEVTQLELLEYLRPSRYCEADMLGPTARAEFAGLEGVALLAGVSSWVGTRLSYVPGSSLPTDGAVRTLLAGQGVCRDYAHLVIGLLRALDVPARLAAVYAPGLDPMDFHAVAEAHIDGAWHVVDATTLAPRSTLVRIATGRDAADTAFLSSYGGNVTLDAIEVSAVADVLPRDDVRQVAQLR